MRNETPQKLCGENAALEKSLLVILIFGTAVTQVTMITHTTTTTTPMTTTPTTTTLSITPTTTPTTTTPPSTQLTTTPFLTTLLTTTTTTSTSYSKATAYMTTSSASTTTSTVETTIPRVGCGTPSVTQTGYVLGTYTTTHYSSTAMISCATGFEGSPGLITCKSDRMWSTPTGCSPVDCGTPSVTQPGFVLKSHITTHFSSTAVISCATGFKGSPGPLTCEADKMWSLPTGCSPVDCGNPVFEGYMLYSQESDTLYNATVAVIACATGYEQTSSITTSLTCTLDGTWETPSGCTKKESEAYITIGIVAGCLSVVIIIQTAALVYLLIRQQKLLQSKSEGKSLYEIPQRSQQMPEDHNYQALSRGAECYELPTTNPTPSHF